MFRLPITRTLALASFTVTVTFGRFGFYSSVDMGGTLNVIKGGQPSR